MLAHTRVSSAPDIMRIAEMISRPGIDPRTWSSLAIVLDVGFDENHGYFADVQLLPTGGKFPARVGSFYAGPGFGAFMPLEVDDEVKVCVPDGDPAAGLVVVARLWDGGTPPPKEIAKNPTDLLILAKEGATVRLAVQGAGNVIIDARGSGEVRLGDENAGHRVIQGDTFDSVVLTPISGAIDVATTAFAAAVTVPALEAVLTTLLNSIKAALGNTSSTYSPNVRVK